MAAISRTSVLTLLAILASAPLSSCEVGGYEVLGYDPEEGIFGIPISNFEDLISKPNATGAITFSGPTVSDFSEQVQYTLRLDVTADVSLENATSADQQNYTMASVLYLESDDSSLNQSICAGVFSGLATNVSSAAQNLTSQDGEGCDQILSEECVSDLKNAVSQNLNPQCGGLPPTLPDSCTDQFIHDYSGAGFMPIINNTQTIFYEQGSAPRAKGDEGAWTAAATNIFPVLFAFVSEDGDSSGFESQLFLNCIKADTFSKGTTVPSTTTGSGSSGATATSTNSATSSPSGAASQAGLSVAAGVLGLGFNVAMWFL